MYNNKILGVSSMLLDYYLKKLGVENKPEFINKYLETPSLLRLKKVGYFCGMDYASKDIYDFSEYISRYDHSLSVALLTYHLTHDKKATLAALFHDVATPCFSHVIDYMNGDYEKQESTEEFTEKILKNDTYLLKCLQEDNIDIEDIINFKQYSIVDNDRPKLCADRLDGIILTGMCWTKSINKRDISNILKHISIYINEDGEEEIGFDSIEVGQKVLEESEEIDLYCHSNEDNYMMQLLASMTKTAIEFGYLKYEDLYYLNEEELLAIFSNCNNTAITTYLNMFKNIKLEDIPQTQISNLKAREINPLVNNERIKKGITYHL